MNVFLLMLAFFEDDEEESVRVSFLCESEELLWTEDEADAACADVEAVDNDGEQAVSENMTELDVDSWPSIVMGLVVASCACCERMWPTRLSG